MLKHARAEGCPGMFCKVLHAVKMQPERVVRCCLKIVVEKWTVIVYFFLTLWRNENEEGDNN